MKHLHLFIAFFLMPVLVLSCACGAGNQGGRKDGSEPDLTTIEGQWRDSVHTALSYAYEDSVLRIGQYQMPIWWKVFGFRCAPQADALHPQRPLLLLPLHGGGDAIG